MQYIEAPSNKRQAYRESIFLAGGISDCEDWQKEVSEAVKDLELTVFNPRRQWFDVKDPDQAVVQIHWEYRRLRKVTQLLFWFCKETLCPITLLELGAALERGGQKLFLGCHPDYTRQYDVLTQSNVGAGLVNVQTIHRSKENLIAAVRDYNILVSNTEEYE